jgi:integrase/recombinase XerD
MDEKTLSTIVTSSTVDLAIAGWLDAKFHKSKSERTRATYQETITLFRAGLQHEGLDLDSDRSQVALVAQAFAGFSTRGKDVAPATYNQRLAILSSFYTYARKHDLLEDNPIDRLDRSKVQAYAGARPIDAEDTTAALHRINRALPQGARDYALLAVLLQTGRRLSEVARLHWRDVSVNKQGIVTITFHAKGGKVMVDTLPKPTSRALLAWLHLYYGKALGQLSSDAPLWISLERGISKGKALGIQGIADVCEKHLGTSKVHATRHTWAHAMEEAGASVSEIQMRLGHESLATTGRYLAVLNQAKNKYSDALAALFGIE